jgi:lipoprotein NlpI
MTARIWFALGIAIGFAISPVLAQSVPEAKCTAKGDIPDDERIAGCSTLLESNKYGTRASLTGLFIRANTSFRKKQFDAAIADYTEIIRRFPNNEFAYLERGVSYYNKGELGAADNANAAIKKGQICEANFYSAELVLQRNDKDEASRLLKLAVIDCPKSFVEYTSAKTELGTLDKSH